MKCTASVLILVNILMMSPLALAGQGPERLALWPGQAPVSEEKTEAANAFLTVLRPENANGMAMIICPGGGYGRLVKKFEGNDIARWLNRHGIVGVVLEYRLPQGNPYRPLYDVQRAIRTVRSRARAWNCDPEQIGVIGFSAGGHVASMAATHFDKAKHDAADPVERVSSRPDFAALIYPVITMRAGTHGGSRKNLLGSDPSEDMVALFSNEEQVTAETPPTFLAHAADDRVVIHGNSKMFYDALIANNVRAEYLQLPSGGHGLNGYNGPMWDAWQAQLLEWLQRLRYQNVPGPGNDELSESSVPERDRWIRSDRAGNPILKKGDPGFLYTADPAAEVFNGRVYVYCSHDQPDARWFGSMQDYVLLESGDLKTWKNHGVILKPREYSWAHGQMNAPDVAYKDGWYYFYFPFDKTHIGVSKSRSPVGPWQEAVDKQICTIFDPCVFVDDDGQAYIYGNDHKVDIGDKGWHVMGARLKSNMIELDGSWHRLSEETVNEAVHVFKRKETYYFMARKDSKTVYFMSDSPLPAKPYAKFMGAVTKDVKGAPAHTSAIEFNGQWYLFYHLGQEVNSGAYHRRSVCFDKMDFNADGTIRPVRFTLEMRDREQQDGR